MAKKRQTFERAARKRKARQRARQVASERNAEAAEAPAPKKSRAPKQQPAE